MGNETDEGSDAHLVKQHPAGMSASNMIGHARFVFHSHPAHYEAAIVTVHPDWRRKGIATAMYDASRQHLKSTGGPPQFSSWDQTENGKEFWKGYQKHLDT